MSYHVWGWLSSILFLLTWLGLWQQIKAINQRRTLNLSSTRNLSINQFGSSYLAFYANFIFGIALEPLNHYLVWTRLGALVLLLFILFRIWQDRPNKLNTMVLSVCNLALILGLTSMMFRPYPDFAQFGTTVLMMFVTLLLLQGTLHQCWLIYKTRSAGDVSANLFKSILVKDASTLAFAFTMPFSASWPLVVLNGSSILSRGLLLFLILKYPPAQLQATS